MRKTFNTIILSFLFVQFASAQEEMHESFKKEIDHQFNYTASSDNNSLKLSYASSAKEITVFDNASGNLLWNKKYKEISDEISKVDEIIPLWDANTIFLFDRKMGKDKMACVNIKTGSLLWISSKYQNVEEENVIYLPELDAFGITTKEALSMVQVQTGVELWNTPKFKGIVGAYIYKKNSSELILMNMKASVIGSIFAGLKNQLIKINAKSGEIIWEQIYRGIAERKVLTKEKVFNLNLQDDKIILTLNGMQVFEEKSGAPIWSAAYDETPNVVGKPMGARTFGVYGTVAVPIIEGDFVYVLDMENKRNQFIKKYEKNTGKLIWKSPEIKDAKVIPNMFVYEGNIILQVGGVVEVQYETKTRNPDGSFTISRVIEGKNVKPYNIQNFDTNNGTQIWESEKMKKGITNCLINESNLIVCSGKALYSMDIKTGKENYEKPLKDDNIGEVDMILDYKENIIIIGEKGVSSRKSNDGVLSGSSKYRKSVPYSNHGQYIFDNRIALQAPNGDVAMYNLDNMKYLKYDARKDASVYLSFDGTELLVFENGGLIRKSKFTKMTLDKL